jgi:hypothetical protein
LSEKRIFGRAIQKHDIESNWLKATNFIPMQGEIIIYDIEVDADGNTLTLPSGRTTPYAYERFKIGDGIHLVSELQFADESLLIPSERVTHGEHLLSNVIETYIISIDYNTLLAFDTSELVFNASTSVLGQGVLGQMILA